MKHVFSFALVISMLAVMTACAASPAPSGAGSTPSPSNTASGQAEAAESSKPAPESSESSSTKITNLGALKIVLGAKNFILYFAYVMVFAFVTGLAVNLLV